MYIGSGFRLYRVQGDVGGTERFTLGIIVERARFCECSFGHVDILFIHVPCSL